MRRLNSSDYIDIKDVLFLEIDVAYQDVCFVRVRIYDGCDGRQATSAGDGRTGTTWRNRNQATRGRHLRTKDEESKEGILLVCMIRRVGSRTSPRWGRVPTVQEFFS